MGSFSLVHWLIVILVIMLLFGRGRISDLMGDMAKGINSFKKGLADDGTPPHAGYAQPPQGYAPPAAPYVPPHLAPPVQPPHSPQYSPQAAHPQYAPQGAQPQYAPPHPASPTRDDVPRS